MKRKIEKRTIVVMLVLVIGCMVSVGLYAQTADEWYKSGVERWNQKDYTKAIAMFSEAISRLYNSKERALKDSLERANASGRPENFSYQVTSTGINSFLMRGHSYYRVKNYDAAIKDYETVVSMLSEVPAGQVSQYSPSIYSSLGDTYGAKKEYNKAVPNWEKYLELKSPLWFYLVYQPCRMLSPWEALKYDGMDV